MNTEDARINRNEPTAERETKYEAPKILASYEKEELEELIKLQGQSSGGCGSVL